MRHIVQTQELQPGDRIKVGYGRNPIYRTVSHVTDSGWINGAGERILTIHYQEGQTPEWGDGNTALPTDTWRVDRED